VLQQALKDLERYWLAGGARPFMTGQQLSVPDLLCVCELEQLRYDGSSMACQHSTYVEQWSSCSSRAFALIGAMAVAVQRMAQ
jgi:hypothetical protein